MNKKNLKTLLVLLILFSLSVLLGIGYWMTASQKKKIQEAERTIEELKKTEQGLKDDMAKFEKRQKKVLDQNMSFRDETKKYQEQKKAILEQVRSSVAGFETFRQSATEEIARLKNSAEALEKSKKVTEEELQSVEALSQDQRERLTGQVVDLSDRIQQLREAQAKLTADLNNKDRTSMVSETAKLHYNLGNYYFRNHEYENAAEEYKKALVYSPKDADANFNLALVSDDYLEDRTTAIFRYRRYLELRPNAVDHRKIRSRILDLELRDKVMDEQAKKENHEIFNGQDSSSLSNFSFIGDKR